MMVEFIPDLELDAIEGRVDAGIVIWMRGFARGRAPRCVGSLNMPPNHAGGGMVSKERILRICACLGHMFDILY